MNRIVMEGARIFFAKRWINKWETGVSIRRTRKDRDTRRKNHGQDP